MVREDAAVDAGSPTDAGADVPLPTDGGGTDVVTDGGFDAGPPRPVLAIGSGAGAGHTCAVLANGTLKCWGYGVWGQLGDGTKTSSLVAVPVKNHPAGKKFDQVAAGQYHSCAHATSGEIYCWGNNGSGMLGDGTSTERLDPGVVSGLGAATMVSIATTTTCAIDGAKTKCWSTPNAGALARPDNGDFNVPKDALEDAVTIANPIMNSTMVATGADRACVLQNGGVKCWGQNNVGQVGAASCTAASCPPTGVTGVGSGALEVRAGLAHTCAIVSGDAVKCWGYNAYLELGASGGPAAVDVSIPEPVAHLALGGRHTCALTKAGDVWCWGRNAEGEVGKSPVSGTAPPTKVPGLSKVVQIAAGAYHTCALVESGDVLCWGSNQITPGGPDIVGSLGNGTSVAYSVAPVKVLGLP